MSEKEYNSNKIKELVKCLLDKTFKGTFERYTINIFPERGYNLMGFIHNITVDGYTNEENTKLDLIIKLAPDKLYFRNVFPIREMYCRETYVYQNVLPELLKIQDERKLVEIVQLFPKHYISSMDTNQECVIMEDMKVKGFKVGNCRITVDYPHAVLVMKQLGKFHALSYAIKDQKPEIFKVWTDGCKEYFFTSSVREPLIKGIQNLATVVLKSYNVNENKREVEALGKFIVTLPDVFSSILSIEKAEGYEIIIHGDFHIRNLLFKYPDPSRPNIPTELCMIDWQIAQLGSPALDILYFMLLSSDREFRKNYYTQLIQEYHQSLSSFLRELGCDPEVLFPFQVLLKHLKKFAAYGLYCAVGVVGLNMKDTDDTPNFHSSVNEDMLVKHISSTASSVFIDRIRDILSDLIEYGYDF